MAVEDTKAFEEVAVPQLDVVYRVALRLTRNQHEAEDLVQETFLKAHKAFPRFEMRKYGIRPWLLRILHNTFLNRLEREKRAPTATDQQTLEQVHGADASSYGYDEPSAIDYENLDSEVKVAIDRLGPEFRAVLSLWATMEFSYKEIAEILELPIGTVMSRLHRARRQLMEDLEEYAREHRLNVGDSGR